MVPDARTGVAKGCKLLEVVLAFGLVGTGQVADQRAHTNRRQPLPRSGQQVNLIGGQTQTVHAGIDMYAGRQASLVAAGGGGPGVDLVQAVQHRGDVAGDKVIRPVRNQTVEDEYLRVGRHGLAQGQRFVEMGDEEGAAPGSGQAAGDLWRAKAIAIGLHDTGALGPAFRGSIGQKAIVGGDGAEIYLQPRQFVAKGRAGGGHGIFTVAFCAGLCLGLCLHAASTVGRVVNAEPSSQRRRTVMIAMARPLHHN